MRSRNGSQTSAEPACGFVITRIIWTISVAWPIDRTMEILTRRVCASTIASMARQIDHPALQRLKAKFTDVKLLVGEFRDMVTVVVPREHIFKVATFLRDDPQLRYDMLADLNGVDYLNYPGEKHRFGVNYGLTSVSRNERLWLKVFLDPERDTKAGQNEHRKRRGAASGRLTERSIRPAHSNARESASRAMGADTISTSAPPRPGPTTWAADLTNHILAMALGSMIGDSPLAQRKAEQWMASDDEWRGCRVLIPDAARWAAP